jgi:peptide/nickel transport system substrate-binding protein
MTTDFRDSTPRPLTRRDLLKAGGLAVGALSLARPAAAQTPKPGGVFISAQNNEATGLDPQLVPAFSRSRRSPMLYNQLVRYDADMNPVPELAESWEVSKDSLTWTFKLRQGVKFHDGQEMTSADVKFTFDRLFEKSPGKSDFIAVDKVEPTGKHAIKFVTKEPSSARPASRSTATSTRPRSAPAPSCSRTGRSSSRWC